MESIFFTPQLAPPAPPPITMMTATPRGEPTMTAAADLARKKCQPCEGGVPPLTPEQVRQLLQSVPDWRLTADKTAIRREWTARDFAAALVFFHRVGEIAEAEGHHPDLHLTGYRNAAVELTTHALGGLSENDFILAAKIDQLPVALKK
jgi:4a-hydroxytetrahydrobiopterin dehydratase